MNSRTVGPALALGASLVSLAGVLAGLHFADGAVHLGHTSYRTEFLDYGVLMPFLVVAAGLMLWAALVSWVWGAVAVVGCTATQWYGAMECVRRYTEGGWADGLEVFAYLVPIGVGLLGLAGLAGGALLRLARRRSGNAAEARPA